MDKFRFRFILKELRREKGLSQKKLAELIGSNNSSVCDWECGRSEPSLFYLVKLCKTLEVSADYLLGISDF